MYEDIVKEFDLNLILLEKGLLNEIILNPDNFETHEILHIINNIVYIKPNTLSLVKNDLINYIKNVVLIDLENNHGNIQYCNRFMNTEQFIYYGNKSVIIDNLDNIILDIFILGKYKFIKYIKVLNIDNLKDHIKNINFIEEQINILKNNMKSEMNLIINNHINRNINITITELINVYLRYHNTYPITKFTISNENGSYYINFTSNNISDNTINTFISENVNESTNFKINLTNKDCISTYIPKDLQNKIDFNKLNSNCIIL